MLTLSRWLTVVSKSTHLKPNSASLPSQLPRPACSRTRRLLPSCGSGSKPWRPPWRGTRHSQTCSTSRGLHPHDVEALVACHLLVRVTTVSPGLLQGPPHSCPCPPLRSVLSTATWGPLRCPPQTPGSAAKPGPCAGPAARTLSLLPEHAGHTPRPPRGLTPARHSLLGEPLSPPPTPRLEGSLSSTGDGVCWQPVSLLSAARSVGLGVSSPHGGPSLEHGGLGEYLPDACAKVCQVRVSPGAPWFCRSLRMTPGAQTLGADCPRGRLGVTSSPPPTLEP